MVTFRERVICSRCEGSAVITRENPQPGQWFIRMGLKYQPGLLFTVESGKRWDKVLYGAKATDTGLSDGQELAERYNQLLAHDTAPQVPCSFCMGIGTRPKPLEREEQAWDRGELQAESFMNGGMQGVNDFQDEWSEYIGGTGSHADPLQKQIETNWAAYMNQTQGRPADYYEDRD